MQRTRWQTLVVVAVLIGLGTYVVLDILDSHGIPPVPVPTLTALGPVALAVVVLMLGRAVRRMVDGEDARMTSLGAARVVILAKASALGGAALAGYFAAQLSRTVDNLTAPAPQAQAWSSGAALVACLALVGSGLLVEWWCRLPPEDDEPDNLVGDST